MNNNKKGTFYMQLNSLNIDDDDPSILKAIYSVHDFNKSENNDIIEQSVCKENMATLMTKPIVCRYISKDENNGIDALTNHEQTIDISRDTGEEIPYNNTIAIGTITNVYMSEDENPELIAEATLWFDKYYNICSLLMEWMSKGINISTSVEYLYCNYKMENKIKSILSPIIYLGLCVLNSEKRGELPQVVPAYNSSHLLSLNEIDRWDKAVCQAITQNQNSLKENVDINNNGQKEENLLKENMFYKAICELSFGDIREEIMTELSKVMTADEFYSVWVSNYSIYDTYFIYESYITDKYVNFKVSYVKTETEVTIDLTNKTKVERSDIWVEVSTMQTSVNELQGKIDNLTIDLTTANESITSLNSEKETLETNVTTINETITSLNTQIETLQPIVDTFNVEKLQKSINEKKEYYSNKFKAVNAVEKFNSEEVQTLITNSVGETDESKDAILSLNSMLVDLVQVTTIVPNVIRENASKNENLIPTAIDFDSRYKD